MLYKGANGVFNIISFLAYQFLSRQFEFLHLRLKQKRRNSAYDVQDEWMYFKAGVYSGNNSGSPTKKVRQAFTICAMSISGITSF